MCYRIRADPSRRFRSSLMVTPFLEGGPMLDKKRREFITLLGSAAVAWPRSARAQQAGKVYRIGFLSAGAEVRPPNFWSVFVSGLQEAGWIEGKNIEFARRYAENMLDRFPELATELAGC